MARLPDMTLMEEMVWAAEFVRARHSARVNTFASPLLCSFEEQVNEAVLDFRRVIPKVLDDLSLGDSDEDDGIVFFLVALALFGGVLTTFKIIKATARKVAYEDSLRAYRNQRNGQQWDSSVASRASTRGRTSNRSL